MKTTRVILTVFCVALILCMPIFLSSPIKIMPQKGSEEYEKAVEENIVNATTEDGDSEIIDVPDDLFSLFVSTACAEGTVPDDDEVIVEELEGDVLYINPDWKLPIDFSPAPRPNPAKYTENGYKDQSISVQVETREMDGITVNIAFVRIADPSQLRTAVAGDVQNKRVDNLETIAGNVNPVIAMNGDLYTQLPEKKTFEVRMGEKIRMKTNNVKDILVIDDLGDFHLFIRSEGLHKEDHPYYLSQVKEEGRKITNVFTFGPALVKDGVLIDQKQNENYSYAPNYKNPRSAIGQTGELSYVMVIVSGVRGTKDGGATFAELARIMYDLGCVQAYNLDGGNTAQMIMAGPDGELKYNFSGDLAAGDRGIKDIIYFATAVPESEWK